MHWRELFEFSFYMVETFALPFAILVFVYERRKERQTDEEELYQRLSDEYTNFLKLVLDNADLQLLNKRAQNVHLSEEQQERRLALFGILVSIFERAYILVYDERMSKQTRRLWSSWEDYMREWCRRSDFRSALPELLEGEDPEFRAYIEKIASQTDQSGAAGASPADRLSTVTKTQSESRCDCDRCECDRCDFDPGVSWLKAPAVVSLGAQSFFVFQMPGTASFGRKRRSQAHYGLSHQFSPNPEFSHRQGGVRSYGYRWI